MKTLLTILAACALVFPTGCTLTSAESSGVTVATSLAVNAYPAAAPFVETAANAIRQVTANGPVDPATLNSYLTIFQTPAQAIAGKISPKAVSDVSAFFSAVEKDYLAAYPKLQKGEMTVEEFAAAVEKGA